MTDPLLTASILAPLAIYALSVPLPGPGFFIITKASVSSGFTNGSAAALGTTLSVTLYAVATVLGASALLAALPMLAITIQMAGGLYLLYLGYSLLRHAMTARSETERAEGGERNQTPPYQSFRNAFLVGLGNPKMIAFFTGLLAPALAADLPVWTKSAVVVGIVLIDLLYHQTLALATAKGSGLFSRLGRGFDTLAGGAMMLFGFHLIQKAIWRS